MKVKLYLDKNIEENAGIYYEKAKKLKKKIEGATNAIERAKKKLKKTEKIKVDNKPLIVVTKKRQWYEKFRWFYSSEEFLCIGGRDATTNDILIKKHREPDDIVFHATIAGSPFFIIKGENKKIGKATLEEAAQATAIYSRSWKLGYPSAEVFYVKPDQVSLTPQSGEFMPKGSFMIYGKTEKVVPKLEAALGKKKDGVLIGGPVNAVKKHAQVFVIVKQGETKPSDIAKKIRSLLKYDDVDEIIRFLPGNCVIVS